MEDIPNDDPSNPFLVDTKLGGSPKDNSPRISLYDQFVAVITLDKKNIKKIPYIRDAKVNAVILIYLSLILDAVGISGFDFRMSIDGLDPLTQLFVLQPLFLLVLAVVFRIALKLHGTTIETGHVFVMIGYSHIWTILSALMFIVISDTIFFGFLLIILLDILYLSPIILAFVDGHKSRYFSIGFTMNILFFLGFFVVAIPFIFLFH